ncbi:PTS sugar transporter subunit IIA [Clostridium sp.]|uniref:PTS sugar transporter subunit IIA n=1 Tax=Clostridium sp. TaxID=1506 RepID=UPI003F362FFD
MENNLFDVTYMDLNLVTKEKEETIRHLANLLGKRTSNVNKYVEDVLEREIISTTGIGDGIAIPHAKSKWINKSTVVIGKSNEGVEWESMDNEPAKMIFLIAVPEGEGNEHLKILQVLAVSLMDDDFRGKIEKSNSKETLAALLKQRVS